MTVLGLDIGGANIKAADSSGQAISCPFAIWQSPDRLVEMLTTILATFPVTDQIALTMTAELADCFATKTEGVRFVLNSVGAAMDMHRPEARRGTFPTTHHAQSRILIWSTQGRFLTPEQAVHSVRDVAAANWHALATWLGHQFPSGKSILIDIGTTTTDIIPIVNGSPKTIGLTDVTRLQSGELCYSGVWRTPLCSIAHSIPFRDGYCALAAERFATTADIYLLLGQIPEDEQNTETANAKPATRDCAHDRMARMLCCDRDEVTRSDVVALARFLADVQRQRLAGALNRIARRIGGDCGRVIISGSGSFLAHQLAKDEPLTSGCELVPVSEILSPAIAEAACAYALARLLCQSQAEN